MPKSKRNEPADPKLYEQVKTLVKSRVKVWPSAYASGQLVKEYKNAFANKYGTNKDPYLSSNLRLSESDHYDSNDKQKRIRTSALTRWFDEIWVNVCETDDEGNFLPCGRTNANLEAESYPYCRPLYRINEHTPKTVYELTADERKEMCSLKRSLPQGLQGKPTRIYVSKNIQRGGAKSYIITLRELTDDERKQSSKKNKKYVVELPDDKKVYFGHNQYEDYTIHQDPSRFQNYLNRHAARENWDLSGIDTPGFWSRWLLWNLPSFSDSIDDMQKRFDIKIFNQTDRYD